jgi:hypothetical protein
MWSKRGGDKSNSITCPAAIVTFTPLLYELTLLFYWYLFIFFIKSIYAYAFVGAEPHADHRSMPDNFSGQVVLEATKATQINSSRRET